MSKVTNLSKAIEIVRTQIEASTPKSEVLELLVKELSISRSNAFVYFTKATKSMGVSVVVDKSVKTVKPAKFQRKSSVTELSTAKASTKLNEIDQFLASVKRKGSASPFAGL